MPVNVRQSRDGEAVKVPWTFWHFGILLKEYPVLSSKGIFTVTEEKHFACDEGALWTDGEPGVLYVWDILPGDTLEMWR